MTDHSAAGKKRGKRISEAEFRRLWADMTISQSGIGRLLGISGEAVRFRAASRDLPPRPSARAFARRFDHAKIVRLYRAGLAIHVIAGMEGCSASVVHHALRSAGVSKRGRHDPGAISLARMMRGAMAATAREEQAALWNAEMVDNRQAARWPSVRAA